MYMANAKVLCLVPNATYIPLTRVGGFALGNAKKTMLVSPMQNSGVGGHCPTPTPDAMYFASQCNIGFRTTLPFCGSASEAEDYIDALLAGHTS